MSIKTKKQKPSYSVRENVAFALDVAWKDKPSAVIAILAQIFLTVAISTTAIFLPKVVFMQIENKSPIYMIVVSISLFTLATTIFEIFNNYLGSISWTRYVAFRLQVISKMLFKSLSTDYANLEKKDFTDLKEKSQNALNNNSSAAEAIYGTINVLGQNVLGFIVYTVLLVAVNPLVLLITGASAVLSTLMRLWVGRWEHDNDDTKAPLYKRINYINNLWNDTRISKDNHIFPMFGWINDVFSANVKLLRDFELRAKWRHLAADVVECFSAFLREGVAYGFLIWQVLFNGMAVDNFVLLFGAISGFSGWITGIMSNYAVLHRHSLEYCRIREYLTYPETFNRKNGNPVPKSDKYCLEMRNVTYRYNGAEDDILKNINLTVSPGENLAIVGLNGAGKTTIVKLLCGFYDPTEGEILLNGVDIRTFNRIEYYQLFTAVFQEFNILPITIAQNIAQCKIGDVDEKRVEECLEIADIKEKVDSLPNGKDSLLLKDIYDEAVEFSGGETQRLVLARALYKNAPILILDEPTAALDPIAESKLYQHYNDLTNGRTSLYISHRLASTRFCHRIILIADKGILESGTHEELMQLNGKYAELFEIQSRYYKEEMEAELV